MRNIYDLPGSLKAFSIVAVLILTSSNILLTLKLLHTNKPCDKEYIVERINSNYSSAWNNNQPKNLPAAVAPPPPRPSPSLIPPVISSLDELKVEIPSLNMESEADLASVPMDLLNIDLSIGRWDNKRMYKIFDFALVGEKFEQLSEKYLVTLATQTSVERLHFLTQVTKHWTGPISVAVFASGSDEFRILQHYITYLRLCYDNIRDNISWHLAMPRERIPNKVKIDSSQSFECDSPEKILKHLLSTRSLETIKWRLKNVYPQNVMRNLARKGSQTEKVFLTDVDIIPSVNMTDSLDSFLRSVPAAEKRSKVAYVIPTYELDLRVKFPEGKPELLRLVKKGLARPFHEKVFIYNQFATNFSKWGKEINDSPETHVSHNVTNFEFLYEPFYVASDLVPIHDERFMGYGFTRNSQVYEMYVAGYQFQVLSPIFTIHWGLQQKKTRPAWREQQNNMNRKQFEMFKKEILLRYSKTNKSTGKKL